MAQIRKPHPTVQPYSMQPSAAGERHVAIYLRVSTDQQTTANQLPDIERLCAARGWTITHRYQETISGAARSRPELERMLVDAHRGEFRACCVWALDRLG